MMEGSPIKPETREAFPEIAGELDVMAQADQAMRTGIHEGKLGNPKIDEQNTKRMKEIVAEIGWPTISKVGKTASYNAWVLVQHADHDVPFQAYCLQLLKEAPPYDIDPENLAYLEDRVRVNQGRPQLYGTQFDQIDNQHVPYPIEDIYDVDARRAAFGMKSLQAEIDMMYQMYPFDTTDSKP